MTRSTLLGATLGFHSFEFGPNPNVANLWDSFWWAMVTVTTVGYGDIYPVTSGGRLIAIALMLVGIGTLGVFTATIAGYVVRGREKHE
jgi:voltage-gated potassium channel